MRGQDERIRLLKCRRASIDGAHHAAPRTEQHQPFVACIGHGDIAVRECHGLARRQESGLLSEYLLHDKRRTINRGESQWGGGGLRRRRAGRRGAASGAAKGYKEHHDA
jgi:hypothetical protein